VGVGVGAIESVGVGVGVEDGVGVGGGASVCRVTVDPYFA
jgi:hypothetical protein